MGLTITLQDLDQKTEQWLQAEAQRTGDPLAIIARRLLERGLALEATTHHDLDWMLGSWTEDEAAEFEQAVVEFEQVDETMWR